RRRPLRIAAGGVGGRGRQVRGAGGVLGQLVRSSTDSPERRVPRRGAGGEKVAVMCPPASPRTGAQPGEKVLITGIAGGQGRLIARRLGGEFALAGVDRVPRGDRPAGIPVPGPDLPKQ